MAKTIGEAIILGTSAVGSILIITLCICITIHFYDKWCNKTN